MASRPGPVAAHAASALAVAGLLAACGGSDDNIVPIVTPAVPAAKTVSVTVYPATTVSSGSTAATQDLLTGGIGKTGIGGAAPAYADPLNPTAAELRRNTIYSNYRGLIDFTAAGGYGVLYGPNVDVNGVAGAGEGLIPGREYVGLLDDGTGKKNVSVIVQIPDSFSPAAPCVVLGPSSGSRGVYGAVGTASDWGLKHGCAVALTDAGKGIGLYDMTDDTVNKLDGTRATRAAAGTLATFAADVTDAARTAFNALFPNRLSLKQAHSQQNSEKDWGLDTLAAARYALASLNDRYGTAAAPTPFTAANTIVMGGSASNGGAAVIHAGEQDTEGLIDGIVAGEPVTEMPTTVGYGISFGGVAVTGYGKTLADFTTYGNIYQPCAALAAPAVIPDTPVSIFNYIGATGQTARATARCTSLAAKGLVTGADTAARSLDALNKLRAFGWTTFNDQMHNAHYALGNGPILSAMYPMMYGRYSVVDNICNTSFAQVDATGAVIPVAAGTKAASFALANGTANGTPASVVYNDSVGGARVWNIATSPSTSTQDFGLDNALCQRALVTGLDETGGSLPTTAAGATNIRPTIQQSDRVRKGIAEVLLSGNLHGKPTIIVAGRSDALVPVNNNARAYTAYNRFIEGSASPVRYIEVENAQHFDTFVPFSGFDTRFVPLHPYFVRAMDAMYAFLKSGTALPPSQVVRTTVRGGTPGAAPAITAANVPAISAAPAAGNQITFSGTTLAVPN